MLFLRNSTVFKKVSNRGIYARWNRIKCGKNGVNGKWRWLILEARERYNNLNIY